MKHCEIANQLGMSIQNNIEINEHYLDKIFKNNNF